MIRFNQFSLSRGTKPLFEGTTFALNPGEKAGLVGANGAGKSTLFSVLRGELHADGGDVSMPPSWQIAHVSQETPAVDRNALDYTLDGDVARCAASRRASPRRPPRMTARPRPRRTRRSPTPTATPRRRAPRRCCSGSASR